jgi:carbon monoxide dehydrogenase subunit G
MKLEGSYKLGVKKDVVWKALNNPEILKKCIPGCEVFEREGDEVFNAVATNQIGPMNATFSGKVTLSNVQENQSYTLSGEGQSAVGFANGQANVKLSEENGFTVLSYEVDITVGGKIAQLGSRLIDGVAKKMSDYFFGRFADIVSPVIKEEQETGTFVEKQRVKEIKSNFLNKYIYSAVIVLILLLVVIFYFVSR